MGSRVGAGVGKGDHQDGMVSKSRLMGGRYQVLSRCLGEVRAVESRPGDAWSVKGEVGCRCFGVCDTVRVDQAEGGLQVYQGGALLQVVVLLHVRLVCHAVPVSDDQKPSSFSFAASEGPR